MAEPHSLGILEHLQPGASNSYILAGDIDVGIQHAMQLAQRLNCQGDEPDQLCRSCRQFKAHTQTVVTVLTPGDKASIGIEPIRQLLQTLSLATATARSTRVVIIQPADVLTTEAQNALLKTLEEPPAATVILLVSTRPQRLIETVRSRCPILTLPASAADNSASTTSEFLQAPPYQRLVMAKKLADSKPELLNWAADLQTQCLAGHNAGQTDDKQLNRQLAALEQFRRYAAAGVSTRACIESLALELPA